MRRILVGVFLLLFPAFHAIAASPEAEKAFLDAYSAAYANKDEAAMRAFLWQDGADPDALEFYLMSMTADFGGTLALELQDLDAESTAKADAVIEGPGGGNYRLAPKPYKKLVAKIEVHTPDLNSTATNEAFVADVDGKLFIATPQKVK